MPDTEKIPFGQSVGGKAAAIAMALACSLFIALFLLATLPDKNSSWEKVLPVPGMSEAKTEAALLRARYLHEAAVRPEIIKTGFFSAEDAGWGGTPYRGIYDGESFSETLTDTLWTLRPFPTLHEMFLGVLLDTRISPKERLENFYLYGDFFVSIVNALIDDSHILADDNEKRSDEVAEWFGFAFLYFANDPRLHLSQEENTVAAELFAERLAFACSVFPKFMAALKNDLESIPPSTANKTIERLRGHDGYLKNLRSGMAKAVRTMWEKRADPSFAPLALEIIASNEASLLKRCELIPLAAELPGLTVSEYFFRRKYRKDLASIVSNVGDEPSFYIYPLRGMNELIPDTANRLKSRGTFILSEHSGPGVSIEPANTLRPVGKIYGKLYLLADMDLAIKKNGVPEYDLSRAYPIFQSLMFRHMEKQPLVLPLNPSSPKDASLIDWYAKSGWKEDRTLLFSAVGSPAEVARHCGLLHLIWLENDDAEKDGELSIAYLHPENGHFMAGILPTLKGKAVSRFLGPVTAIWFGIQNVNKNTLTEEKYIARPETFSAVPQTASAKPRSPILDHLTNAKPEKIEQTPPYSEATATILIDGHVRSALTKSFERNSLVRRALDAKTTRKKGN